MVTTCEEGAVMLFLVLAIFVVLFMIALHFWDGHLNVAAGVVVFLAAISCLFVLIMTGGSLPVLMSAVAVFGAWIGSAKDVRWWLPVFAGSFGALIISVVMPTGMGATETGILVWFSVAALVACIVIWLIHLVQAKRKSPAH